ncbi:MAG: hypothetical protein FWB94_09420 [Chitinispirillia bacterium]|nr:hypothetical protein [Chitinispirillia bacterium]
MNASFGGYNPAQYMQRPGDTTSQVGNRFAQFAAAFPGLVRDGQKWQDEINVRDANETQGRDMQNRAEAFVGDVPGLPPPPVFRSGVKAEAYAAELGNWMNSIVADNPLMGDYLMTKSIAFNQRNGVNTDKMQAQQEENRFSSAMRDSMRGNGDMLAGVGQEVQGQGMINDIMGAQTAPPQEVNRFTQSIDRNPGGDRGMTGAAAPMVRALPPMAVGVGDVSLATQTTPNLMGYQQQEFTRLNQANDDAFLNNKIGYSKWLDNKTKYTELMGATSRTNVQAPVVKPEAVDPNADLKREKIKAEIDKINRWQPGKKGERPEKAAKSNLMAYYQKYVLDYDAAVKTNNPEAVRVARRTMEEAGYAMRLMNSAGGVANLSDDRALATSASVFSALEALRSAVRGNELLGGAKRTGVSNDNGSDFFTAYESHFGGLDAGAFALLQSELSGTSVGQALRNLELRTGARSFTIQQLGQRSALYNKTMVGTGK